MKRLITILAIVLTLQVSSQTTPQLKRWVDSKTELKTVKVKSFWKTIFRNETMLRPTFGDSILIIKNGIRKRLEIPEKWLIKQYVVGDSTFHPTITSHSFRKVLFYSGAWEYQQKVDVWVEKELQIDKDKLLLDFVIKANKMKLNDDDYRNGLEYARHGDKKVVKDSIPIPINILNTRTK